MQSAADRRRAAALARYHTPMRARLLRIDPPAPEAADIPGRRPLAHRIRLRLSDRQHHGGHLRGQHYPAISIDRRTHHVEIHDCTVTVELPPDFPVWDLG